MPFILILPHTHIQHTHTHTHTHSLGLLLLGCCNSKLELHVGEEEKGINTVGHLTKHLLYTKYSSKILSVSPHLHWGYWGLDIRKGWWKNIVKICDSQGSYIFKHLICLIKYMNQTCCWVREKGKRKGTCPLLHCPSVWQGCSHLRHQQTSDTLTLTLWLLCLCLCAKQRLAKARALSPWFSGSNLGLVRWSGRGTQSY